jgi:hypothetical protein
VFMSRAKTSHFSRSLVVPVLELADTTSTFLFLRVCDDVTMFYADE